MIEGCQMSKIFYLTATKLLTLAPAVSACVGPLSIMHFIADIWALS